MAKFEAWLVFEGLEFVRMQGKIPYPGFRARVSHLLI